MSNVVSLVCGCTRDRMCPEALRLWMDSADAYQASQEDTSITARYTQTKDAYKDHREGRRFSSAQDLRKLYRGYNNRTHQKD